MLFLILLDIHVINFLRSGAVPGQDALNLRPYESRLVNGIGQVFLQSVRHLQRLGRIACVHAVKVFAEAGNLLHGHILAVIGSGISDLLGVRGVFTGGCRLYNGVGRAQVGGVKVQIGSLITLVVGCDQTGHTGVRLGREQNAVLSAFLQLALTCFGNVEVIEAVSLAVLEHRSGRSLPCAFLHFGLVAVQSVVVAENVAGVLFGVVFYRAVGSPDGTGELEKYKLMTCVESLLSSHERTGGFAVNFCR